MSKPRLVHYMAQFQCSECGRTQNVDSEIGIDYVWPEQRYTIGYVDMINLASEYDFLIDENGEMTCFDCVHKRHVDASLPSIAEHNTSLCRR